MKLLICALTLLTGCSFCRPEPVIITKIVIKEVYPDTGVDAKPLPIYELDEDEDICTEENLKKIFQNSNNTMTNLDVCDERLQHILDSIKKLKEKKKE